MGSCSGQPFSTDGQLSWPGDHYRWTAVLAKRTIQMDSCSVLGGSIQAISVDGQSVVCAVIHCECLQFRLEITNAARTSSGDGVER